MSISPNSSKNPPPFRPIWPGTRGGVLDRSAQNFGKWTLFWPISLVKSHFGGSKIAIFSRLRRAQQGKMLFLVAPQAKILGIYLVKSTKPLKYCVFSVFALRITKKRSQSRISQILRIWVSGTRGGVLARIGTDCSHLKQILFLPDRVQIMDRML